MQDQPNPNFWTDWGSLTVAAIALVQPWLIAAGRRWFRPGKLRVHESHSVEFGYSSFGPTVGLTRTIRALHRDVFVQQATVRIVRERDNAVLVLPWTAFRSVQVAAGSDPQPAELASSFLLPTSAPLRYNVFFSGNEFASDVRDAVTAIKKEWLDFVRLRLAEAAPDYQGQLAEALRNPVIAQNLFERFRQENNALLTLYTRVGNGFYWHAGNYLLTLEVEAGERGKGMTHTWRVTLSTEEENRLRLNVIAFLQDICGLPVTYDFAYLPYQTAITKST